MAQTYSSLWYHLVWSTKNRMPFLNKSLRVKLFGRFYEYCKLKEYHLDKINGVEDHIHLLISIKPSESISNVVRNLKTDSFYWLKENNFITDDFGGQDGYSAFTVSERYLENLKKYIQNQEKHHEIESFVDEVKKLTEK